MKFRTLPTTPPGLPAVAAFSSVSAKPKLRTKALVTQKHLIIGLGFETNPTPTAVRLVLVECLSSAQPAA
uniref:Putative secreted protein n=1 Tax=Anopheles darlingi TaxID=43151 RepID=A0A2M4DRC2_ANODA